MANVGVAERAAPYTDENQFEFGRSQQSSGVHVGKVGLLPPSSDIKVFQWRLLVMFHSITDIHRRPSNADAKDAAYCLSYTLGNKVPTNIYLHGVTQLSVVVVCL
jgi:hypothetical protein